MTERNMTGDNTEGLTPPAPDAKPRKPAPMDGTTPDPKRAKTHPGMTPEFSNIEPPQTPVGPKGSKEPSFSSQEFNSQDLAAQFAAATGEHLPAPSVNPSEEDKNAYRILTNLNEQTATDIVNASTGRLSPKDLLDIIADEGKPGQLAEVKEELRKQGKLPKEGSEPAPSDTEPETPDQIMDRDQLKMNEEKFRDEMNAQLGDIDFSKPLTPGDETTVKNILATGRKHLADLLKHPFFESKGFKITKKSFKVAFLAALLLALALFALETQFLIAIGKGGGGK